MKLYKVPNGSRIRVVGRIVVPPAAPSISVGDELLFEHIDGMYSLCCRDDGAFVHLGACTEVELLAEGG